MFEITFIIKIITISCGFLKNQLKNSQTFDLLMYNAIPNNTTQIIALYIKKLSA